MSVSQTQFVILRGTENCGKTTLCAEIYRFLLSHADKEHLFGKPDGDYVKVTQDSIQYDNNGDVCDFKALLTVGNKKVGFFSMGDYLPDFYKISIRHLVEINVDVIVCCTRSRNRTNSTFRYIEETYAKFSKKGFWVRYAEKKQDMCSVKQKQAIEISEFILNELKTL